MTEPEFPSWDFDAILHEANIEQQEHGVFEQRLVEARGAVIDALRGNGYVFPEGPGEVPYSAHTTPERKAFDNYMVHFSEELATTLYSIEEFKGDELILSEVNGRMINATEDMLGSTELELKEKVAALQTAYGFFPNVVTVALSNWSLEFDQVILMHPRFVGAVALIEMQKAQEWDRKITNTDIKKQLEPELAAQVARLLPPSHDDFAALVRMLQVSITCLLSPTYVKRAEESGELTDYVCKTVLELCDDIFARTDVDIQTLVEIVMNMAPRYRQLGYDA